MGVGLCGYFRSIHDFKECETKLLKREKPEVRWPLEGIEGAVPGTYESKFYYLNPLFEELDDGNIYMRVRCALTGKIWVELDEDEYSRPGED